MLDLLDKEFEKWGYEFVWYVDDFIILVKMFCLGECVFNSISRFLCYCLKLVVNIIKSYVVKISESKFFGFIFKVGCI